MARKKKHEEHENHERWLVYYADFITLLFAFFVVMYSISSVNEGKYRVLSDTMVAAFKDKGTKIDPIQIGVPPKKLSPINNGGDVSKSGSPPQIAIQQMQEVARSDGRPAVSGAVTGSTNTDSSPSPDSAAKQASLDSLNKELQTSMASLISQDMMTLRRHKDALEIELKSNILFARGQASLSIPAEKILIRLGETLAKFPNSMQIEGHTDNQNVNSAQFPSNWELSSARASAVAHLFSEHGMDPERMWAVGYAEYRPKVDNLSDEMRSQNRRVVLMIRPKLSDAKKKSEAEQTGSTILNIIKSDSKADVESSATKLNTTLQPMLQDSENVGEAGDAAELNVKPQSMLRDVDSLAETLGASNDSVENVAPLIAPIQLPFLARPPIVRDSTANEAGR